MKKVLSTSISVILVLTMVFSLSLPTAAASKVKLNKTKLTLYVGATQRLKVKGTSKKVEWSSTKVKIASVNKYGKITAKKAGKSVIKAKVGKKTLSCKLTVKKPELERKKLTLYVGKSKTVKLLGAKIKSVKSSNRKVATVTKKGKITAKKAGKSTITYRDKKNKKYTMKLTVKKRITVSPTIQGASGTKPDIDETNTNPAIKPEPKPEVKPTAAEKYASHPSLKLYGEEAIPYYNSVYASKSVSGSTESGNNPTITPYIAARADSAVIIYPGGGYYQRTDDAEGIQIAKAYNRAGISAFVVRYRVGDQSNGYNDQAIITDGQRAVQFVRYNAAEFDINPNKIAVCGFSAGGHLAMSVSQNQMEGNPVGDAIGEISNIPNAVILCYAVTTLKQGTFAAMPSILGQHHTAPEQTAILDKYSGELHAQSTTPPTFLWYGKSDTAVFGYYNSAAYYNALSAAGAVCELKEFQGVGHGVGLAEGTNAASWHSDSITFLKTKAGF